MTKESKEVAAAPSNNLPAHLQGGKTANIGNVDASDRILPRIKLLQGTSPEPDDYNEAKKGNFWHNIGTVNLGESIRGIPIIMRKSWVLWSPRGDSRGVLARANDGVHWDLPAGTEFEVKPKNSPVKVVYVLGETVQSKGPNGTPALSEFGSSIPGDPNSPPAAALTYQFLWYLPDHPELSPCVIINTRSSVKPAKDLLSKIDMRPVDHYAQVYNINVVKAQNNDGEEFYNYLYTSNGYADEKDYNTCKQMFESFQKLNWAANDESSDTDADDLDNSGSGRRRGPAPTDVPF